MSFSSGKGRFNCLLILFRSGFNSQRSMNPLLSVSKKLKISLATSITCFFCFYPLFLYLFPISAPKEFITFLYETVFKEYLEQGQCTIVHESFSNYISCQCNILNEMNDIQISFNDTVIPITITYLIKSDNSNRCTLQIKENEIDRDIEKFIFGISFLTQYPSLFDYEDESITFFSNNPFSPSNDISFSPPKKILSVLIILIIINILLLFISKRDFISEFEFIK